MNGFTDIHTHILPEVDDGAENMTQALKLLRQAWENGTRTIFLTPHALPGHHRRIGNPALRLCSHRCAHRAL